MNWAGVVWFLLMVFFILLEAFAGGIMTAVFCRLNQINKSAGIHFEPIESKQRIFLLASGIIFFILSVDIFVNIDYDVNDTVQVVNGPLEGFVGTVQEINKEKQKVKVLVSMFGRETPVELEFSQVQKVN